MTPQILSNIAVNYPTPPPQLVRDKTYKQEFKNIIPGIAICSLMAIMRIASSRFSGSLSNIIISTFFIKIVPTLHRRKKTYSLLSRLFYSVNLLFIHYVHCYFKAKTHFSSCRCCPHDNSFKVWRFTMIRFMFWIMNAILISTLCLSLNKH